MGKEYSQEILNDFDLSIIMPYYQKFRDFSKVLPLHYKYFQRNGIEVILVLDESSEENELLNLIAEYPWINWVIITNKEEHSWRNPAKAINVGIRASTKKYIMVCSPESYFLTDLIYKFRYLLEMYNNAFTIGKVFFDSFNKSQTSRSKTSLPYGSLMLEKRILEIVGCYSEDFDAWGGEDDNIRAKLEYMGFKKIFVDDAILIHYEHSDNGYEERRTKSKNIPSHVYVNSFKPKLDQFKNTNWGRDFAFKLYDYRAKSNGMDLCSRYIKSFEKSEVTSKVNFLKPWKCIALIHTFNEKEHISGIINHLETICDGIILLDDGSEDQTYELAISKKILCKVKKKRGEFNELENKNILLNLASLFISDWLFFIDADERFHLFGKKLLDILFDSKKAYCVYLIHLWDKPHLFRTDVPEHSPIGISGVLHRWRFFKNIGRCQINSEIKFHFKHTPFQDYPSFILPILILHHGMLSANIRKAKHSNYLHIENVSNHEKYNYFLDNNVSVNDLDQLIHSLQRSFTENDKQSNFLT